MPIRVQLPNGSFAEFPDGMATADIEAVLARQFGAPEPPDFGNAQGGVASTESSLAAGTDIPLNPDERIVGRIYKDRQGNPRRWGDGAWLTADESRETTLGELAKGYALKVPQGLMAATRAMVDTGNLALNALGTGMTPEGERAFRDSYQEANDYYEQQKPAAFRAEQNAGIVERDGAGNIVGLRAPSAESVGGALIDSAAQLPAFVAGGAGLTKLAEAGLKKSPRLAAAIGYGGTNAALIAPSQRQDTIADAERLGMSPDAAREAGNNAGLMTAGLTALTGGAGGLMSKLTGASANSLPSALARGFAAEAPFEGVEEAGQSAIGDVALGREVNAANALDAGLLAGLTGGLPGSAIAGMEYAGRPVAPPQVAPPVTPSEAVAGPLKPAAQRGEAMADAILGKAKSRRLMADPILDAAALERAGISPIVPPVERPDVFTPELYAALGIQPEPTRDLERLLPESAVPSAPPPVQLDSRPAPVAAPQNLPAPLDTQAASTAQPAEPAAQPFLPERTSGQANPLEAGRLDVAVQPVAAAAPAPVSRDVVGAQAQALTPARAPMSVRVGGDAQAPQQAPTMQNRDRSRAASVSQMQDIRRNPDPERLGFSRDPNTGAPMVGAGKAIPDADKGRTDTVIMASGRRVPVQYAVVEADELAASHDADGRVNPAYDAAPLKALNNGRTAGLQAAYASGNTDAYRQGIAADAALHGVPAEAIAGKRKPVLVRLYDPEQNSGDMGAESNATQQLGLSPVEQAQTDARALPDLSGMVWNEDGSISPSGNASFFRGWFANMGETQAASLQDAQGRPNAMALQRVRGAMVHRAYGDERLLTAMAEEIDPDNRNVMNALVQAAPGFAKLDDTPHASDVKAALVGGLTLLRDAKARGIKLADALAQQDMFGRNADADAVAAFMAANARSANRMAEAFKAVAEYAARAEAQAATLDVFGSAPEPSVTDALGDAGITEKRYGTETGRDGGAVAEGRGGGQQAQEQGAAAGDAFALGAQAQPAAQEVAPPPSAGLFGAPSTRDVLDNAQRNKDAARDGKTGTGRTDMLAGDGELFAGSRPEQADVEAKFSMPSQPFYSAMLESVEAGKGAPKRGSSQIWMGWLDGAQRRGEFKQAERDWLGVDDWLRTNEPVTRDQLADFIRANEVKVEEVTLGEDGAVEAEVEAWWNDEGGANEETPYGDLSDAEQREARERYADEVGGYEENGPSTKFASYQLPGGENYRELLLTLPEPKIERSARAEQVNEQVMALVEKYGAIDTMSPEVRAEYDRLSAEYYRLVDAPEEPSYRSSHFDQPNILAHVRYNERTDADGKRVLFIEEIQSDWHQAGRKRGYAGQTTKRSRKEVQRDMDAELAALRERGASYAPTDADWAANPDIAARFDALTQEWNDLRQDEPAGEARVPDAPFKGTDEWAMLAFKRMVRHAAENGFDRIAWTTGEQQAERYDLSKQVNGIDVHGVGDGKQVNIRLPGSTIKMEVSGAGTITGVNVPAKRGLVGSPLSEAIGKEMAERVMGADGPKTFAGDGLKVGGEGMRGFYDKILPSAVNKWAKKFGGKVGQAEIDASTPQNPNAKWSREPILTPVHAIDLTPQMRDAALQGMPLFSAQSDAANTLASPEALLAELKSSPVGRSLVALEKAGVLRIIHDPAQPWAGKWDGRKATLNAAQIPAGKGIGVALHELGVHAERDSLSGILGDAGFTALLATIDRWADSSDPATRELAANVQRRVNNANTPAQHRDEERLAYAVELAANAGMESGGEIRAFLRRFAAYVKAWLSASKLGSALRARGLNFDLTPQDVAQLAAYAVARQARAVAPSRAMQAAEAFSRPAVEQTQTEAFKRWFGNSKVVDADGNPLVVYHGTTGDFDAFDLGYSGSDGVGYSSPAIFAASDPAIASDYATNKLNREIADAYREVQKIKNENPGDYGAAYEAAYDKVKAAFADVKRTGRRETGDGANVMPVYMSLQNPLVIDGKGARFMQVMPDAIARAVSGKHDGLIVNNVIDHASPSSEYPTQILVAFNPNQIKSATGNSGAFDPSNPSILASMPDAGVEFTNGQEALESRLAQWAAALHLRGGSPRAIEASPETVGAVTRNAGGAAEQGDASRTEIREQSARLIERAKAEGFYWPDDSPILAELGKLPTLAGAEHQVFVVGEGNNRLVIRGTDNGFFGHRSDISPAQYLARLDDYSRTFPSLQTRLIGVSESTDVEGHAVIWTAQTFVYGKKFKTQALLAEVMAGRGWQEDGHPGVPRFKHESGAIIEDAHTDNVFQDDNGDLYPFDVVVEALPNVRYSMPDSEPGFTLTGIPEKRKSRLVEAFKRARQRRNEVNAALGNPATGGTLGYNADKSEWVGTRGAMRQARESLQDRMILLRDVQQDIDAARGEVLPDEQNVYRMENLMYGRVGKSMETLDDVLFDPLFKAMRKAKVTPETLEEYLYARHAKERNADLRENNPDITAGSGMADDEADAILGRATPALESLAKMVDRITQDTRKRLYSHGIITRAQYEAMQAQFKYYVPLRGKAESEALAEASRAGGLGGGGVEVRGSGIKTMTGRGTRAVNILGEIVGDAQRSVIAAEKARVGRALARLVLANPNPALWTLEPVRTERVKDPKTGEIHERVLNESNSPDVVHVRINGQQYRIQFANVKLAEALKNVGADNLHRYLRPLQGLNRYVSSTLTSYNPGFIPVNLTRDAVFGSTRILTEHGAAMYGKVMAAYPKAFAALHKAAIGRPETGRLEEFTSAGAKTGWVTQAAVDTLQKQVRLDAKTGKVADVVRAAKALAHVVEEANSVVENAMRLAYFSALRDAGWTVDAAAEKAKDLTVNFNRQGNLGPWLKVMYLFYNPGVQGAHQVIKALKHPKMKGAMLALGLAQFALAMMAAGMEDDEGEPLSNKVPDFVKERNLWMVWPGKDGEPDRIVTLPMPYGFNVFSFMGGRMAQLVTTDVQAIASNTKRTQQVAADVVGGIGKAILQAFSPVPIDEGMTGLVPTIPLKAVVELGMNKDGLGRRIRNENPFDRTTPLAMQGKADTHEAFKAVARGLNWIGMGDEYHKPLAPLDWAPEDIEYMYGLATGGTGRSLLDVIMLGHDIATGQDRTEKPTPIIKSFTRPINDVSAAQAAFYERKETIETDADRVRDMAEAGGMAAGIAAASAYPHLRGVEIKINKSGEASIWPGDSRVYGAFKAAEKQNDATRRQVKALYGEFGTGLSAGRTKEMRALQQSNADYQRDFIREWNAAADAFAEGR